MNTIEVVVKIKPKNNEPGCSKLGEDNPRRSESFERKSSLIIFVQNLIIACSKKKNENYF